MDAFERENEVVARIVEFTSIDMVETHSVGDSDIIHAVEYRSTDRPLSLHVYHGDLLNADRRMWSADGSNPRPYTQGDHDGMTVEL